MDSFLINIEIPHFIAVMAALISIAWYSSGRFTKIETLVESIEKRLTRSEGKNREAFAGNSPVSLLDKGWEVLEKSGLKEYIDSESNNLFTNCKEKHELDNPYDVQEAAFNFFDELKFDTVMENKLKNTSFEYDMSMNVIRRIGGIYFRDICLKRLEMKSEDLDKQGSLP